VLVRFLNLNVIIHHKYLSFEVLYRLRIKVLKRVMEMKISGSNINMSASREYRETYKKEEKLKMWVGNEQGDILEISDKAKALQVGTGSDVEEVEEKMEMSDQDKRKLYLLQKLLEAMTGKKIEFYGVEELNELKTTGVPSIKISQELSNSEQVKQGWGLEYDSYEAYSEKERVSFGAEGMIKTTDGKEIQFSLNLIMSREFAAENQIHIRAGDAKLVDPLVINFDGIGAELTPGRFSFDLNMDGNEEKISFVQGNRGLLVLDLNHDGKVNHGGELFGPKTGDGFSELAGYDQDSNNWIDENDEVYDQLRIWTKTADGTDELTSLRQKGVGAIYLGNMNTLFSLKDRQNQLQGQVVKTGIYLKEEGTAGTVQQINLTV